ncbi:MAG: lysophospholipid acyltransferase family protein [Ferrimicrobium sp.]
MSQDRYMPPTVFARRFYSGARQIVAGWNRLYWSVVIEFREPLPPPPYILSPTHRSNIDTLIIGSITSDPMTYMAKSGVFINPAVSRILRLLGGFPVNRDATDRDAVMIASGALESGSSLVVYPEGTRRMGPAVSRIEEGASYLSLRNGVPIVPVGIAGSDLAMAKGSSLVWPTPIAVVVGRPRYPGETRILGEGQSVARRVARSEIRRSSEILRLELEGLLEAARSNRARLIK